MPDQTLPPDGPLGDLDGEAIDAVSIKLAGTARFPRRLEDGERVILVIEGTAKSDNTVKRKDGELVRTQTIAVETIGEPTDQLADEASIFLKLITDAERARDPLPFEEDEDAPPETDEGDDGEGWEYPDPDPKPDDED